MQTYTNSTVPPSNNNNANQAIVSPSSFIPGFGTSFNQLNMSGTLRVQGNPLTPIIARMGTRTVSSKEFPVTVTTIAGEGSQPDYSEQDLVTGISPTHVTWEQATNIVQPFIRAIAVTHLAQSQTLQMYGDVQISGDLAIRNFWQTQIAQHVAKMQQDIEYTMLRGEFSKPTNVSGNYGTRGFINAIKTNVVDAAGSEVNFDLLEELCRMLKKESGANASNVTIVVSPSMHRVLTKISQMEKGFILPASRDTIGYSVQYIQTTNGMLTLIQSQYMTDTDILFLNLGETFVTYLNILTSSGSQGTMFYKEFSDKSFASQATLEAHVGLDYGPEFFHGRIMNLSGIVSPDATVRRVYNIAQTPARKTSELNQNVLRSTPIVQNAKATKPSTKDDI